MDSDFPNLYIGRKGCTRCTRGLRKAGAIILGKCRACNGSGKSRHFRLFHGTSRLACNRIETEGFKASKGGIFGSGIYVTGDQSRAIDFARVTATKNNCTPVLMVLDVDLGWCKTYDASGCEHSQSCHCERWISEGYDAQYMPIGDGAGEVTVIRDPRLIKILNIIPVDVEPAVEKENSSVSRKLIQVKKCFVVAIKLLHVLLFL